MRRFVARAAVMCRPGAQLMLILSHVCVRNNTTERR
jgi:hypothetical protein